MNNKQWSEQLLNSPHIGILVVDKERNNIFVNSRLCELFGYEKEFLLQNSAEIIHVNHNTFLNFAKLAFNAVLSGKPLEIDYQFKKSDGSIFWVHISGDQVHNSKEVLWSMVDITDRVKTQQELKDLNERMELALLGNSDGIWDWNLKTNEVYYSPRWKEMLGYKDSELPNEFSVWESRAHSDDIKNVYAQIESHLKGKREYIDNIHRLKHKDGSWVWIHNRAKAIFDEDNQALRMIGTHTDISKEKAQELKYIQQSQVIEQIHDSISTTDLEGNILSWNSASQKMFGYSADEIIGKHISILHLQKNLSKFSIVEESLKNTGEYKTEIELITKSKDIIFVSLTLSYLRDENGLPINIISYSQDITKRKLALDELQEQKGKLHHQAHHDALTGLPNRVLLNDRLNQAIEKAKRNNTKIALLFIDLDHFKEINDSLGHAVGDEVLKIVTKKLQKTTRDEDTVARLGGDEFTIILEDLEHAQDSSLIANKILNTLAQPININKNTMYISSSIGISIYPDDGKSYENLLKFADSAMYKAKAEGRNNYQYYSSKMTELAFERVVMETSIRVALKEEQFIVYYQPQVDGTTDKLIGMEALVRWEHPIMGIIPPAKFIPLAEATGLIIELDQFVMKTAMTQFSQWYKQGFNPGVLALNLAVKQLEKAEFIDIFTELLKKTDCKAEWIELEVTESQIMTKPDEAIKILEEISDLGIELAVDDFGTGYSSLAYLKKLPINKLKIDKEFVRDLPNDEEDVGITRAVIALAKSLNLRIIAEGVETKEQRDFMIENGCNAIQGYFYSKPIPANKLEEILKKGSLLS